MQCLQCKTEIETGQLFCHNCGIEVPETSQFNTAALFENIAVQSGAVTGEIKVLETHTHKVRQKKPITIIALLLISVLISMLLSVGYILITHNKTAGINRFSDAIIKKDITKMRAETIFVDIEPTDEELESLALSLSFDDITEFKRQLSDGESQDYSAFSVVERPMLWPFKRFYVSICGVRFSVTDLPSSVQIFVDGKAVTSTLEGQNLLVGGIVPGPHKIEFLGADEFKPVDIVLLKANETPLVPVLMYTNPPQTDITPKTVPSTDGENPNDKLFSEIITTLNEYYISYLEATSKEDMSLLKHATENAVAVATERLQKYNKGNVFSLQKMRVDLGSITIYDNNGELYADIISENTFLSAKKETPDNRSTITNVLVFTLKNSNDKWFVDDQQSSDKTISSEVVVLE